MNVWCMNLKDNRDIDERNRDEELKFRLCRKKSIIAIGWAIPEDVFTWDEYIIKADVVYAAKKNYKTARNQLQRVEKGDLVWVKNPPKKAYFLVEITDDSPNVCNNLKEFDICGYREGIYYPIDNNLIKDELQPSKLKSLHAIELMSQEKRGATYNETIRLYNDLKSGENHGEIEKKMHKEQETSGS